jgi:hypothetical protein
MTRRMASRSRPRQGRLFVARAEKLFQELGGRLVRPLHWRFMTVHGPLVVHQADTNPEGRYFTVFGRFRAAPDNSNPSGKYNYHASAANGTESLEGLRLHLEYAEILPQPSRRYWNEQVRLQLLRWLHESLGVFVPYPVKCMQNCKIRSALAQYVRLKRMFINWHPAAALLGPEHLTQAAKVVQRLTQDRSV